ncbi:MAG TPA: 4Fe-4S dicluster domain-containing protein [Anaerolineae bacterium]|nr:4Fe-4S dicluster domain-containing protein [Anaerolineae bacterium]
MDTNAETLDPSLCARIASEPGGENIWRCFGCGTCTASCPVREITARYNPRRIIHMARLGLHQVLSADFVWLCSTCYTCQERCPQDVRITDLMHAIKNVAVAEGFMPPSFRQQIALLAAHGRLYDITMLENERRNEQGLPEITESPADIARILGAAGLESPGASEAKGEA